MKVSNFFTMLCLIAMPLLLGAQSPINGFMQGKGKGNVVVSYFTESYDEVFLVPQKIQNVPVFGEVTLNSLSLFGTYGLSDQLDVIVNLPYITAQGSASQELLDDLGFDGKRSGLQDLSVYLKYNPLTYKVGNGTLRFVGALGLATPLSNYPVNEGLQSILAIGNRATSLNTTLLAHYQTNMGLFAAAQASYSLRNNDVPNAILSEIKVGYGCKFLYADAWIGSQRSTSGVDILGLGFEGFFPATKVNYTRTGINLFVPVVKGLGISAGANTYLNGRNVGDATGFYGGIVLSY